VRGVSSETERVGRIGPARIAGNPVDLRGITREVSNAKERRAQRKRRKGIGQKALRASFLDAEGHKLVI
jgi:hypothetical protein